MLRAWLDTPTIKLASQYAQFVLAIVFVALYVYATYSPPPPDSLRYQVDLLLCAIFAVEYVHRMLVSGRLRELGGAEGQGAGGAAGRRRRRHTGEGRRAL